MSRVVDRRPEGENTPGHKSDPREDRRTRGDMRDQLSERGFPKGIRLRVTRQAGLETHPRSRGWESAIFWCIMVLVWATALTAQHGGGGYAAYKVLEPTANEAGSKGNGTDLITCATPLNAGTLWDPPGQ